MMASIIESVKNLMTHVKAQVDEQRLSLREFAGSDLQDYINANWVTLRQSHPIAMEMFSYLSIIDRRSMLQEADENGGLAVTEDFLQQDD